MLYLETFAFGLGQTLVISYLLHQETDLCAECRL